MHEVWGYGTHGKGVPIKGEKRGQKRWSLLQKRRKSIRAAKKRTVGSMFNTFDKE